MSLKARIDKADAELKQRLQADWEAAAEATMEFVHAAPEGEQSAYWRMRLSSFVSAGMGIANEEEREIWLTICGGVLGPQPSDAELLAALDARIPPELMARLVKAAEAARAMG